VDVRSAVFSPLAWSICRCAKNLRFLDGQKFQRAVLPHCGLSGLANSWLSADNVRSRRLFRPTAMTLTPFRAQCAPSGEMLPPGTFCAHRGIRKNLQMFLLCTKMKTADGNSGDTIQNFGLLVSGPAVDGRVGAPPAERGMCIASPETRKPCVCLPPTPSNCP
jgi:hypothetical protein